LGLRQFIVVGVKELRNRLRGILDQPRRMKREEREVEKGGGEEREGERREGDKERRREGRREGGREVEYFSATMYCKQSFHFLLKRTMAFSNGLFSGTTPYERKTSRWVDGGVMKWNQGIVVGGKKGGRGGEQHEGARINEGNKGGEEEEDTEGRGRKTGKRRGKRGRRRGRRRRRRRRRRR